MSALDQKPGRRRAEPRPRSTRTRSWARSWARRGLTCAWLLLIAAALVAVFSDSLPWPVPGWLPTAGAVAVTTGYTFALGVRTGGRPLIAGGLALLLCAGAVYSGQPVLVAAAAVSTAAAGAVLGVLATVPAPRFLGAARECLLALVVAAVAACAAQAYDAQLSWERARYAALAVSLLVALVLVYRLGAGVHGLGRRGAVVVVAGLAVLAVSLAYTEALARWGSPEMIATFEAGVRRLRSWLGAVPRPLEFLLGFPLLAWGVSLRARRRQGWWACAFGAAALVGVSTRLLDPGLTLAEAGLVTAYGVLLGLALGYLVVRADAFLSGTRGRRARRAEMASAHRPEPRRTGALL